jgi:hypothetical protein
VSVFFAEFCALVRLGNAHCGAFASIATRFWRSEHAAFATRFSCGFRQGSNLVSAGFSRLIQASAMTPEGNCKPAEAG